MVTTLEGNLRRGLVNRMNGAVVICSVLVLPSSFLTTTTMALSSDILPLGNSLGGCRTIAEKEFAYMWCLVAFSIGGGWITM